MNLISIHCFTLFIVFIAFGFIDKYINLIVWFQEKHETELTRIKYEYIIGKNGFIKFFNKRFIVIEIYLQKFIK